MGRGKPQSEGPFVMGGVESSRHHGVTYKGYNKGKHCYAMFSRYDKLNILIISKFLLMPM